MKRSASAAILLSALIALFTGCSGQTEPQASVSEALSETEGSADTAPVQTETGETEAPSEVQVSSEEQSDSPVHFSMASGFYEKPITLEMTCEAGGVIRYTTDGSEPDESSQEYTAPLELKNRTPEENRLSAHTGISVGGNYVPDKKVDKANVIRAVAFYPDGTRSETVNGTFWVGINREKKYGDLPVVSILTAEENLFDYDTGIYVLGARHDEYLKEMNGKHFETWEAEANFTGRGREWERPAAVEFILPDNVMGFSQNMGMRIMGAASRNAAQKSIRLIAREEYGKKNVKYEVIPDNMRSDGKGKVEKYKSFVLRNGGNDSESAKVRDPLIQELASGRRFDTLQYTPCVAYIDGEYWGMYTIVEDYSDNYIENNYDIDSKNVVMIKKGELEEGNEEDMELFYELYDFITGNDMSDPEMYKKASEMFDMGSFADYCALNLYIFNEDSIFKDNNWRMWRVREPDSAVPEADGRWRMLVYDTDYSTGVYDGGQNFDRDNFTEVFEPKKKKPDEDKGEDYRDPAELFRSLYKNETFKAEFIIAMCDIRNFNFESKKANERLGELCEIYKQVVPATFERFGPEWMFFMDLGQFYEFKVYELASFFEGRYEDFPDLMQALLELPDYTTGSFSVSDSAKGSIRINITEIDFSDKDSVMGSYFPSYPITVAAEPKEGHSFKGWEYEGCEVSDPSAEVITVDCVEDFSIKAVFE